MINTQANKSVAAVLAAKLTKMHVMPVSLFCVLLR